MEHTQEWLNEQGAKLDEAEPYADPIKRFALIQCQLQLEIIKRLDTLIEQNKEMLT